MGSINRSSSAPGKEQPGQAAARGAAHPRRDAEQTTPSEHKNGDLIRAPLPLLLQMSCHSAGRRDPQATVSPSCNPSSAPHPRGPWEQHVPLLSHVQSKRPGGGKGRWFPVFFWGEYSPVCGSHMPRRLGNPCATEEGDGGVSPATTLIHLAANLLFYCANCQCFHHRENQIILRRDKAKAQSHTGEEGAYGGKGAVPQLFIMGMQRRKGWEIQGDQLEIWWFFCSLQSRTLLVRKTKRAWLVEGHNQFFPCLYSSSFSPISSKRNAVALSPVWTSGCISPSSPSQGTLGIRGADWGGFEVQDTGWGCTGKVAASICQHPASSYCFRVPNPPRCPLPDVARCHPKGSPSRPHRPPSRAGCRALHTPRELAALQTWKDLINN